MGKLPHYTLVVWLVDFAVCTQSLTNTQTTPPARYFQTLAQGLKRAPREAITVYVPYHERVGKKARLGAFNNFVAERLHFKLFGTICTLIELTVCTFFGAHELGN